MKTIREIVRAVVRARKPVLIVVPNDNLVALVKEAETMAFYPVVPSDGPLYAFKIAGIPVAGTEGRHAFIVTERKQGPEMHPL